MNHTITDKDIPFEERLFSFDPNVNELKEPLTEDYGWLWGEEEIEFNTKLINDKIRRMKIGDIISGICMEGWPKETLLYLKRIK
jgi:hypothetical protein